MLLEVPHSEKYEWGLYGKNKITASVSLQMWGRAKSNRKSEQVG